MRWFLIVAASLAASPRVVVDNAAVRVYRTTAAELASVPHGAGVVISLENTARTTLGNAVWLEDVAGASPVPALGGAAVAVVPVVVVQPLRRSEAPPPSTGSRPGESPFTGMSFKPMFENDRVSVIRARMEVGAREGFHTHGADTVVVHLSGGEIEDTADGKTVVNRWTRGDVEFEGRGTSHSARNIGDAVDVVLVAIKPR